MIEWLLKTFPWLAGWFGYQAGKSAQQSTDQAAAQKETLDVLIKRAATDAEVSAASDAAKRAELLRDWSTDSKR